MPAAPPETWPLEVGHVFSAAGPISKLKKDFFPRPEQTVMARAVESGLKNGGTQLIEAGTGVGKSLAYLIPAAIWAVQNNKRVIVSTHTKALQEQLIQHELPFTHQLLRSRGLDLRFTLLMGAENYLCLQRLHRLLDEKDNIFLDASGRKDLQQLWDWSEKAGTGQRTRLPCAIRDELWSQVHRDPDLCLGNRGPLAERCLWRKDFERAKMAHILVVNHALLLSGPAKWLPYDAIVIDEAHNLEDVAANNLGITLSSQRIERLLNDLHNAKTHRGLLAMLRTLDPTIVGTLRGLISKAHQANQNFFAEAQENLSMAAGFEVGGRSNARRIEEAALVADMLSPALLPIIEELGALIGHAASKEQEDMISALRKRFLNVVAETKTFLNNNDPGQAFWAELRISRKAPIFELKMAPIHVGELLNERLFSGKEPTILTSATLSANKLFDIFKERMGVKICSETLVDSPFNYARRVRLFVPDNLPDPQAATEKSLDAIVDCCQQLDPIIPGGIFVLFTSWSALKIVESKLKGKVSDRELLVQGHERPEDLLAKFRTSGRAVLLGTDTFWQGVDVPGPALSCVIVTRLPFSPPDSPLEEARHEWYEKQKRQPFTEYSLPRAIVKFRQGFGRLMRRHDDRGVVVVLDPRVRTKRYGKRFLDSIPVCPQVNNLEELKTFFATRGAE